MSAGHGARVQGSGHVVQGDVSRGSDGRDQLVGRRRHVLGLIMGRSVRHGLARVGQQLLPSRALLRVGRTELGRQVLGGGGLGVGEPGGCGREAREATHRAERRMRGHVGVRVAVGLAVVLPGLVLVAALKGLGALGLGLHRGRLHGRRGLLGGVVRVGLLGLRELPVP